MSLNFFLMFLAIGFLHILPVHAKAQSPQVAPQDRKWLEKFFRDVMLRETAIYTLCGSKPMTLIILNKLPEEQIQAWLDGLSEKEKKELVWLEEPYDLPENWEKWEAIQSKFPSARYRFFRRIREDEPYVEDVYFIDIQQTALAIEEHYDFFRKELDCEFDPLDVTFEIGDDDSLFWQKTRENSTLLGILFGYGKKNAKCFDWKHWSFPEDNTPMQAFVNSLQFNFAHRANRKDYIISTINQFSLPAFASFSPPGEDGVIKKYQKERKKIQKLYKGKDFLTETLRRFTAGAQQATVVDPKNCPIE